MSGRNVLEHALRLLHAAGQAIQARIWMQKRAVMDIRAFLAIR